MVPAVTVGTVRYAKRYGLLRVVTYEDGEDKEIIVPEFREAFWNFLTFIIFEFLCLIIECRYLSTSLTSVFI